MVTQMTEQEKENKKAAMEMIKSNKDDLYRIAQMADKQGDNERADAQLKALVDHYERTDKNAADRLKDDIDKANQEDHYMISNAGSPMYSVGKITEKVTQ